MAILKSADNGVQRFPDEDKDCTVRALANAAGMPYKTAHSILARAGRQQRRGMTFTPLHKVYTRMGFKLKGVFGSTYEARYIAGSLNVEPQQGVTLARMMQRLQNGRYIVKISGHVFAVVDGKMLDYYGNLAGSRVQALWELEQQAVIFDK